MNNLLNIRGLINIKNIKFHYYICFVAKIYILLVLITILFSIFNEAEAKRRINQSNHDITLNPRYASLVVNADTNEVLYKREASKILHPASLTKMMTIYLTFQAIENKKLGINQQLSASHNVVRPRTNIQLKPGNKISVRDAIYAMIIHSANDAAVVLAEAISGTEDAFAYKMIETAKKLGMHDTVFKNANGLHDPEQVTTAYDMAKLAIALRRDYPKYYPMFSKTSFVYNGNVYVSHNRVVTRYRGADGLKTGFINASGFNVVTSAKRQEGKVVAVVMGGSSASSRDNHMISLLEKGFAQLSKNKSSASAYNMESSFPQYKEDDVFELAYNESSSAENNIDNNIDNSNYEISKSETQTIDRKNKIKTDNNEDGKLLENYSINNPRVTKPVKKLILSDKHNKRAVHKFRAVKKPSNTMKMHRVKS
jgi:D-alanyl-D-alanine carboxypeptidase